MAIGIDGNTVKFVAGDTLWEIASYYLGDPYKWTELARINNISNERAIPIGTIIKLRETAATTTTATKMSKAEVTHLGLQPGTDRTIYATWKWDQHDETEKYEYEWYYYTGDSPTIEWFFGDNRDSGKQQHCTFTVPDNAKKILFRVKPIGMTKKEANSNGT